MQQDGTRSGWAWSLEGTRKKGVGSAIGLTKTEAECLAVLSALEPLPDGAPVEVCSDSAALGYQFENPHRHNGRRSLSLFARMNVEVQERKFELEFAWRPYTQKPAFRRLLRALERVI
jgi:ribonuclease HI